MVIAVALAGRWWDLGEGCFACDVVAWALGRLAGWIWGAGSLPVNMVRMVEG